MKERYKTWSRETTYVLLKETEVALTPLGYHIALYGSAQVELDRLELVVYPNVKPEDVTAVRAMLSEQGLHLRSIDGLKKPKRFGDVDIHAVSTYEHGRGKSTRLVLVYLQEAKPLEVTESEALEPEPAPDTEETPSPTP
jgi:hypothetical protein